MTTGRAGAVRVNRGGSAGGPGGTTARRVRSCGRDVGTTVVVGAFGAGMGFGFGGAFGVTIRRGVLLGVRRQTRHCEAVATLLLSQASQTHAARVIAVLLPVVA